MKSFVKYSFIIVTFHAATFQACLAQNRLKYKIKEKIPDLYFELNNEGFSRKISDYRGRILVLDFWSRGCGACVASFPKLEKLAEKRNQDFAIIPVMKENKHIFDSLVSKSQILKESNLDFVVGDTLLHDNFPHRYVPYCVWIDQEGNFIGTTTEVTDELITAAINGNEIGAFESNPAPKVKSVLNFQKEKQNFTKRLLDGSEYYIKIRTDTTVDSHLINSYIPLKDSSTGSNIGFLLPAYPLSSLIPLVFGKEDCSLFTSDDEQIKALIYQKKNSTNHYNPLVFMEVLVPPGSADIKRLNRIAQIETERYFNLKSQLSNEPYPSLILKRVKISVDSSVSVTIDSNSNRKLGEPLEYTKSGIMTGETGNTLSQVITSIVSKINYEYGHNYHFLNETGQNIDNVIVKGYLKCEDLSNINLVKCMFLKIGYQLVSEDRTLKTVKISKYQGKL